MPEYRVMIFFFKDRASTGYIGQIYAAIIIMTADNHIPRFPEAGAPWFSTMPRKGSGNNNIS